VLLYLNPVWEDAAGRLRLLRGADDLEDCVAEIAPLAGRWWRFAAASIRSTAITRMSACAASFSSIGHRRARGAAARSAATAGRRASKALNPFG